jgi:hypothetical protein
MASYRQKRSKRNRSRKIKRGTLKPFFIGGDTDKCLFVSLPAVGGLGNQLFVYATAIVAKNKVGIPMCILPINNPHSSTDYRGLLFKQGSPVENQDVQPRRNAATRILDKVVKIHNTWANTNILANGSKNLIVGDTYFQNYEPIRSVLPTIRNDFIKVFEERYPGYKDTIPANSAFMHVRKGDYNNMSASLGADYYNKCLEIIDKVDKITTIYVISDDIAWCKEQSFSSPKIKWADTEDLEKDELKSFYLMMLCMEGAIISASTFSAWGAMLGPDQNDDSTILYPSNWFVSGNSRQLKFPERWQRVEV